MERSLCMSWHRSFGTKQTSIYKLNRDLSEFIPEPCKHRQADSKMRGKDSHCSSNSSLQEMSPAIPGTELTPPSSLSN